MIYINEWLPNPTGPDADKEFIELFNGGTIPVNLSGWSIAADQKKKIKLPNRTIAPGGYLVLRHTDVKLTLKNTAGGLWLYGSNGQLVDGASFIGSAPDGRSFSRVNYGAAHIEHFLFTAPTPGAKNKIEGMAVAVREYPLGIPLAVSGEAPGFLEMMFGVAFVLPFLFLYVIQSHKKTAELFF